jgi:hypothetical protein
LRSTGDEPYLAIMSMSRATPMLFSAEVQNTGMKDCFCNAACSPPRNSSSVSEPFSIHFSINVSSASAMYSINRSCARFDALRPGAGGGRFGEFAALVAGVGDDFAAGTSST